MLQAEVTQIEKSEKRMSEIKANRNAIFNDLIYEVRTIIADESQWVDLILKAQAEELNL